MPVVSVPDTTLPMEIWYKKYKIKVAKGHQKKTPSSATDHHMTESIPISDDHRTCVYCRAQEDLYIYFRPPQGLCSLQSTRGPIYLFQTTTGPVSTAEHKRTYIYFRPPQGLCPLQSTRGPELTAGNWMKDVL